MANFPSKWFDFLNQKELKRLRKDVNNTLWLKIQIATSVIIALCTLIFSDSIKGFELGWQIGISVGLSFIVILVFCMPWIIKQISLLRINNSLINGKTASTIFDEEIVYNVLVASEFYEIYNNTASSNGKLSNELKEFYEIEVEYYVKTAIEKLNSFASNLVNIVGSAKYQISVQRIKNIIQMIDLIVSDMKITIDDELLDDYNDIKKNI